jgi:hypothetical protein
LNSVTEKSSISKKEGSPKKVKKGKTSRKSEKEEGSNFWMFPVEKLR